MFNNLFVVSKKIISFKKKEYYFISSPIKQNDLTYYSLN